MQTREPAKRGGSPEAIQAHYDVGDHFYRLWLDPTLSYSCALWGADEPDDQLEAAQRRKIEYHTEQARARGAARVLDVGCGWGAVLKHLVDEAGVDRATGLTLSRRQANWVSTWRHPRLDVRLESWADHAPLGPYDAIISIGAFEHFARPEWSGEDKVSAYRSFFARCHSWLRPGGYLSLQTIAYGNANAQAVKEMPEHRFLLQEVFPEAELPTLTNLVQSCDGLFEWVMLRNDREDYERTCRVWGQRLVARKAEATAVAGGATVARYVRYLKMSSVLFHYGRIGLLRLTLRRLDEPPA
jgi:cyclopropane-fatty-acyl-phospholipid synthase